MKKLIFCLIFGPFLTVFQKAEAQKVLFMPYYGANFNHMGVLNLAKYPTGGVFAGVGLPGNSFTLGMIMSGGERHMLPVNTTDSDGTPTIVYKKINAPALYGVLAFNVKGSTYFNGPTLGIGYGLGFPEKASGVSVANVMKFFAQINYSPPDKLGGKYYKLFAQGSFNFLTTNQTNWSAATVIGTRFSIP